MSIRFAKCTSARRRLCRLVFAGALLAGVSMNLPGDMRFAQAASQRIVVVVNDHPITNRDVEQRVRLNAALGNTHGSLKQRKKKVLNTLINEVVARAEVKRRGVKFDKKRVDTALERMAKGSNTTVAGLTSTLKKKGVSMTTLRAQVEASMNLRWIISKKHKSKIEVNEAELDKRYKKFSSDPRLKPVTVYLLREVDLRVQNSGAMTQQLLYARAVEAQQIAKRYSGCTTLKAAAKGIFDVKVSGVVQAPADKMPAEMRKVLKKAGTKKLIGPMKVKTGIRMIAFCGIRKLKPPKPPREVVKNMMLNEKYEKATNRVMRDLRRRAFIEYKDKSATLTQ